MPSPATAFGGGASEESALLGERDAVQFLGPRVKGYPLDFCSRYSQNKKGAGRRGSGCGQEAADLWCRARGFGAAAQFLTTPYAPDATWCIADGAVNPADPDDRDSAVGQHTYFTNITCVATAAAAGPGPEEEEGLWGPKGEIDGEVILAPVTAAADGGVGGDRVSRTSVDGGMAGDGGVKAAVGDAHQGRQQQEEEEVVMAAVAEGSSGGGGGVGGN